jgi:thiamine pyrophosphate-dependent acetolactate synthase large subunit-like protein
MRIGSHEAIKEADVILILDCDVPWIPTRCRPRQDATIFHIDVDPLKQQMPLFYIPSQAQYRADTLSSVEKIVEQLRVGETAQYLAEKKMEEAQESRQASYSSLLGQISHAARPFADGNFGTGYLSSVLRRICPEGTIWAVEAVTNTESIHDHIQPTEPGSWINCGGGGLGWSGGAALGIKLATDVQAGGQGKGKFVCQIVGDGTYLFSVPGSVYWISRRYNIPILTIVLNNDGKRCMQAPVIYQNYELMSETGWNAPRKSYMLVHPEGEAATATNEEINISFSPAPDYAAIAAAAGSGQVHPFKVSKAAELESILVQAVAKVQGGQTAVVDCKVALDH